MAQASLTRVLDLAEEDGGMRNPLAGMFPPDLAVPITLAAAVAAVQATLPTAAKLIKMAEKHGRKVHKKTFPHIPPEVCACITFYTMEETPKENSPYYVMNK